MKLFPYDDLVLIKPPDPVAWTSAGLYLPPVAREEIDHGQVLATGPGTREVIPDDEVWYDRHTVTEIGLDGRTFLLLREPDVIAKLW